MAIKDDLMGVGSNLKVAGVPIFKAVFYGDDYEANNSKTDDTAYPLCQVAKILTAGFDVNPKTGSYTDKWNIFIFFCDKTENTDLDTTADLNDEVIERMRNAAKLYFRDLFATGLFELVTKVELKSLFFNKDASMSGVLAFFTVKERRASIICFEPPPPPLMAAQTKLTNNTDTAIGWQEVNSVTNMIRTQGIIQPGQSYTSDWREGIFETLNVTITAPAHFSIGTFSGNIPGSPDPAPLWSSVGFDAYIQQFGSNETIFSPIV